MSEPGTEWILHEKRRETGPRTQLNANDKQSLEQPEAIIMLIFSNVLRAQRGQCLLNTETRKSEDMNL